MSEILKIAREMLEARQRSDLAPVDALQRAIDDPAIDRYTNSGYPKDSERHTMEYMVEKLKDLIYDTSIVPHQSGEFGDMKKHWGIHAVWRGKRIRLNLEILGDAPKE